MDLWASFAEIASTYGRRLGFDSDAQLMLKSADSVLAEHLPSGMLIRGSGGKGVPTFTPRVGCFDPDETESPPHRTHIVRYLLLVVALVLILGLASCGGDDDTEATATSTTSPTGGEVALSVTIIEDGAAASDTTAPGTTSSSVPAPVPIDESTDRVAPAEEQVTLTDRLAVQPVDGGVYLLGNSMFATGVDLEAMQAGIPERDVRFNYYDGHYTSLWYLIAKGALGPSEERPELIVWGFRPRYAMVPAFRQNRPNSTELFEFADPEYDLLTRDSLANEDFITGPTVEFADGFIPRTAESFEDSGLAQLVVIWRPVTVAQGTPDPNEERFVADAIAYFKAQGIPYVDFFHDDQLELAMFAKGDHHNADGRARVTDILTERIREVLSLQS